MKNIVIIGAGDLGKEIIWLIEDINKEHPTYVILGFLDDDPEKSGKEFFGYRVLGTTQKLNKLSKENHFCAVIAIQDGKIRKKIAEDNSNFHNWENIIHPTSVIAGSTLLGKGNIFFPQTVISVDCRLGNFGLYYLHTSIGNDCTIGDYVSVMLNASIAEHVEVHNLSIIAADSHVQLHTQFNTGEIKKLVLILTGIMML